jgi:hypothetical protein
MKIKDSNMFTFDRASTKSLVESQAPAPAGRHFLVIKKNGDGRPCAWGKGSEFADCVEMADQQWDQHGEVDATGKRTGCCYPGETFGGYEVHLVSDKPLHEQA